MIQSDHRCRDFFLIAGLVMAVALPFSGRAFHLDDNFFLRMADVIRRHPLNPYADSVESGFLIAGLLRQPVGAGAAHTIPDYIYELPEPIVRKMKEGTLGFESLVHPPLLPYYLALVTRLSGGLSERSQHIAYQLFSLLAALTAFALARRFTRFPLWATLFFVASAVFVISSHSLMSDMPMVAFYQAAVWFFVWGIDRGDRRPLFLAGVCMALAFLTRYSAATLVPVLLGYGIIKRAPLARLLLPFLVFLAFYGLWETPNVIRYGRPHLLASGSVAYETSTVEDVSVPEPAKSKVINALRNWAQRGVGSLGYVGVLMVFPLALLSAFVRGRGRWMVFAGLVSAGLLLIYGNAGNFFPGYSFLESLLVGLCVALGLFVPGSLLVQAWGALRLSGLEAWRRTADDGFLLWWLTVVLASSILALPFAAARYLFPLVFPLIALFVNRVASVYGDARRAARFLGVGFGLGLFLSLNLAFADYQQAEIYRSFVQRRLPGYQSRAFRVWYVAEWGFRHYAEQLGGIFLPPEVNAPTTGDLIIVPKADAPHAMTEGLLARSKLLDSVACYNPSPFRLLDDRAHAGYYSHGWGYLPFSLSRAPAEQFDVYIVTADDFFTRALARAERRLSEGAAVDMQWIEMDGQARPVIWETPTARLTYRLPLGRNPALSFYLGYPPDAGPPDTVNGVQFEVQVREESAATPQTLFSQYVDPKNRAADHNWSPFFVDLRSYAGKAVALSFITTPGPRLDAGADWAGWLDPKLVLKEAVGVTGPP